MRSLLATAAAVLLLTGLSACTDDDPEPRTAPPPESPSTAPPPESPSTTTPTSPTTTPPTSTPPAADETAEEFIRRWQAAGDEMQVTGETEEYEGFSIGCDSCDAFASNVRGIYSEGGSVDFSGSKVVEIVEAGTSEQSPTYDVTIRSGRSMVIQSANEAPVAYQGGLETIRVTLLKKKSSWVVTSFSRLAQ